MSAVLPLRKANKLAYFSWKVLRQNNKGDIDPKWDRFEQFLTDIGTKPSPNHILAKTNKETPWGPDNFYWRELVKIPGQKFDMKVYNKTYKPKYDRERRYKLKYGITIAQYDQMLKDQDGKCANCGKPETQAMQGIVRQLAVDHDHKTGKVRGLLCNNCNAPLGHVNDSVETLCGLIKYLAKHSENPKAAIKEAVSWLQE